MGFSWSFVLYVYYVGNLIYFMFFISFVFLFMQDGSYLAELLLSKGYKVKFRKKADCYEAEGDRKGEVFSVVVLKRRLYKRNISMIGVST